MVLDMYESEGIMRKKERLAGDTQLDAALYQWFVQSRAEEVPLSGPIVKAQVENLNNDLHWQDSSFRAGNGWLHRFKKRHGISTVTVSGEIRSSDSEAAMNYSDELREIIEESGYSPDQIYKCDETGLCYKMMPHTTLAVKKDEHKHEGFKKITE